MRVVSILLLSFCGFLNANAQEQPIQVEMSISATKEVESRIKSFFRRELRELRDVKLVDQGGDAVLRVVAMTAHVEGRPVGVAISTVGYEIMKSELALLRKLAEGKIFDKDGKINEIGKAWAFALVGKLIVDKRSIHLLNTTPEDNLKSTIEGIIADFDDEVLEKIREERKSKD